MKRRLLFIILLLGVWNTPASYAQNTFAPVGAEWWYGGAMYDYNFWDDFSYRWVDHMRSVKDTSVAGKDCRMLAAERYRKSYGSPNTVSISNRDTFYIYDNADTVFIYDKMNNDYTPLYIFNANVGDTLCLRRPNVSSGSAEYCIVIDSIKLETYDTVQLKSYYNHTIQEGVPFLFTFFNWGGPKYHPELGVYTNAGKYTEKIGGNWPKLGSFLPNKCISNPDYYKESEPIPTGEFRCYFDPSATIKVAAIDCDSVIRPFVSIPSIVASDYGITVYPNPSNGIFNLTAQKPLKDALSIQVTDLSGRTMHTTALPAGKTSLQVDLGALQAGIYLLVLRTADHSYYQKITIQR